MSEAERAAHVLRGQILEGSRRVGAALPPERELAQEFGLSRTTMRAALSLLEAEGLVERRVGRGGGTFVTEPGRRHVTDTLQRAVGMSGFSSTDLVEARLEIEPRCAALAAARIRGHELAELGSLQGLMARTRSRSEFLAANARFHALIAEASGNAVLAAIIGGLASPIRELTDDPLRIREEELRQTVRVHEAILRALSDRDAAAAESAMRAHMRAHGDALGKPSAGRASLD